MQASLQNMNFVYLQKTEILILHLVAIIRDKKMGLLSQFSTTFTSHLICTQQPYCTRTNFPIELDQVVGQASSGAI